MEKQKKKKKPDADVYTSSEEIFGRELGPLMRTGRDLIKSMEEAETAMKKSAEIPSPGERPSLKDYIGRPLQTILISFIVILVLFGAGWLILLAYYNGWTRFCDLVFTEGLVLIGISALIGGIGFYLYNSCNKEWKVENDMYMSSAYRKWTIELSRSREAFVANKVEVAKLLKKRTTELLALSDNILEGHLASGDMIFQREIKLAINLTDWADEESKKAQAEAADIKIDKSYDDPDISAIYVPAAVYAVIVVVLIAFHCIIWVLKLIFNIPWDTWNWASTALVWAAPIALAVMIVIGLIWSAKKKKWGAIETNKKQQKNMQKKLTAQGESLEKLSGDIFEDTIYPLINKRKELWKKLFARNLAFPIRDFDGWNHYDIFDTYFSMTNRLRYIQTLPAERRTDAAIDFYNKKLGLFFKHSIRSEAGEDESLYKPFEWALSNKTLKELRANDTPDAATKSRLKRLDDKNRNFIDIDGVIEDFQGFLDIDTSGTFFEHDSKKVERKTKQLQQCYNDFSDQVNSFGKLVAQINASLGMSRMIAYRNLYLGAELVNIIHETANGGMLTRIDDNLSGLSADSVDVSGLEAVGVKQTAINILDSSLGAVAVAVDNVLNNKAAKKYYKKNPKEALATAAVVAVGAAIDSVIDAWKERNALIARCSETQQELAANMESLVEQFLDSQAKASRAIELIGAIIKVNDGFMAIYEPLRDKVFVDRKPESVSLQELQQLVLAIKEYKSISDSKI